MPSEIMDQRSSTGSHFFEDVRFSTERQVGFWKTPTMADNQVGKDGLVSITGSKLPVEKRSPNGMLPVSREELAHSILAREGKAKIPIGERSPVMSNSSINCVDNDPNSRSSFSALPASHSLGGTNGYGTQWESSLFSSSFSDIFSKKLQLSGNDVKALEPKNTATSFQDEELFESLEEIEAQTIGNLLPAEDDLFSGVTSDLGCKAHGNNADELEDFDLFSSSGGMELEGDDRLNGGRRNPDFFGGAPGDQGSANGSVIGVHPNGEHPSRTLFVRNINSNVEDSELKSLFEQYGEVRTLYTACKHRGFVMISYYDIRAGRNAMRSLQNKPLRRRKLDIHYSIPKENPSEKDTNQGTLLISNLDPSVTKDELHKIFSAYGEIKEIRDTQHKSHQKCIEYYDIRAAEAALSALNRSCIAGKQIEIEHSHSGGSRWLMDQPDQDLEESHLFNSFDDYLSRQMGAISPEIISSGCMENGSTHVRHSVVQSPSRTLTEPHWSSSVPSNVPSPVAVVSISKQYGLNEQHRNADNIKFSNQGLPSFYPHSLPDYHDGLVNGIPYTSSNIGSMACNIGSGVTEAVSNRHVGVGSNGHPVELKGGVFGSAGNGTGPLPGHHYMWNNSIIGHQQSSSRMIWSNSQSFINGIHARHLPQMTGFPRASPVMLNAAPALHHVGSAPAVNPSIWERRHAYLGESPDASRFYLGSTGSVGFSGSSPPHPLEVASRNILSPNVGNFVDMTRKAGMRSPQQMHMFPGRSTIISMPSSFESPSERIRCMSQRRTDTNGNNSDKKQYELDLERILRGDDNRTTLMIKNIPNKYTSKMLLSAIDEFCRGTYDFIYLPIDFKNKCNVGYAFINMIEPQQIIPFHKAFNGNKWEKFNSEKVASLAYARIQGKAALVAHFQNSSLMNEDKRCRPILFHTDGPNAGDPEPFPMGTSIRSRMGKQRASNIDDNLPNGNHSILANPEDSSNGADSSISYD